jgi:glycosyltransferase involved in cell wall biosynthesis
VQLHAVHISTLHPAFDPRIFHRECGSLAAAGARVTYLGNHGEDRRIDGIELRSIGQLSSGARGRLRLVDRAVRTRRALADALALRADVYHLHDPELLTIARPLKRRSGAKVVYDSHEHSVQHMLQKGFIPVPLRRAAAAAVALAERRALPYLDGVVTADRGVADHFRRIGAAPVVLHNFVRQDLFEGIERPEAPAYDLAYHGSLTRFYLETCFEADDELQRRGRSVRWLFIGQILHADRDWVPQEVRRRGAEDRFDFRPRMPHEEIPATVAQARLGIIPLPDRPKYRSNIPTKLFEFMALGMPVVLSDLPPTRGFVADGSAAIAVPPEDPVAYAAAIGELLDDPARMASMGRAGRRKVAEGLNWATEATKLVQLYERMTGTTLTAPTDRIPST